MNGNLLCANSNYLITGKQYSIFNSGVVTYQKLLGVYMQNNCSISSNENTNINITLTKADYIPGTSENITGAGLSINISCNDFRKKLIDYSNEIYKASLAYESNLKLDLSPHIVLQKELLYDYNKLIQNRTQLDQNMQKILAIDNTHLYEKQNILDSAVFTTLLWTILATSALYYAFTKI